MRAAAEEKLRAMEDELSYYLDVEWTKIEPSSASVPAFSDEILQSAQLREETGWQQQIQEETARQLLMQEEMARQLQAQIDAEKKARVQAEQSYAAAEAKIYELEAELRKTEDRYRQSEAGMKKVLRKQEADLRSLSEQVQNTKQSTNPLNIIGKTLDGGKKMSDQELYKAKLRLVGLGITIGLLVSIVITLVVVLYYRLF
jgi:septal ring factor EnvC (AmiA/AmiB activator)